MPEIIPELRGRRPLPPNQKKVIKSWRVDPNAVDRLQRHVKLLRKRGSKITETKAVENAIMSLEI